MTNDPSSTRSEAANAEKPPKKKFLDLSLSQVIGGSLAAATAAALGSRLGVAGTVIGTALISVISATGAAFYTASLRHGRERVQTVVVAARGKRASQSMNQSSRTVAAQPVTQPPADDLSPVPNAADRGVRKISKKPILIAALTFFLIAILGVTGFELITGSAISGGGGTTIGRVVGVDPSTTPATPSDQERQPAPSQSPGSSESQSSSSATAPPSSSSPPSDSASSAPSTPSSPAPSESAAPSSGAAPTGGAAPTNGSFPGTGAGASPSGTTPN